MWKIYTLRGSTITASWTTWDVAPSSLIFCYHNVMKEDFSSIVMLRCRMGSCKLITKISNMWLWFEVIVSLVRYLCLSLGEELENCLSLRRLPHILHVAHLHIYSGVTRKYLSENVMAAFILKINEERKTSWKHFISIQKASSFSTGRCGVSAYELLRHSSHLQVTDWLVPRVLGIIHSEKKKVSG